MSDRNELPVEKILAFGPFKLLPRQKLLLENELPVALGSRALELLIVLAESAGEVISLGSLIARVWPKSVVETSCLRVHISAIRKRLRDGEAGARYIANVSGRGYSFVAPVSVVTVEAEPVHHPQNLPVLLSRVIGRAGVVASLSMQLGQRRLITIVGAGGLGKTTVAVATAWNLLDVYRDGVCFVDLSRLNDPAQVPAALGAMLNVRIDSEHPLQSIEAALKGRKLLIVLDNCEHVIEAAAAVAEGLLRRVPTVHLLATSREPLDIDGEWLHRLAPLSTPAATEAVVTAQAALAFSAVELLVERLTASTDAFELSDADAVVATAICRRLDGNPLAIELAAAKAGALAVCGLAAYIADGRKLLSSGRRTALQRHRTLQASMDWSYELLTEREQKVFSGLSTFVGGFTLTCAAELADEEITADEAKQAVLALVAKSLVIPECREGMARYRLAEIALEYALERQLARNAQTGRNALGCYR